MGPLFMLLSVLTVAFAIAAVTLRQLVHGALCLAAAFACLALIYLELGAQFVGLAQILVYVGAVAILIVFAILLTRSSESWSAWRWGRGVWWGLAVAVLVFCGLAVAVMSSRLTQVPPWPAQSVAAQATVSRMGHRLMTDYVVPLEVIGLLLTAALIGAVLIALDERGPADRTLSSPGSAPDRGRPPAAEAVQEKP